MTPWKKHLSDYCTRTTTHDRRHSLMEHIDRAFKLFIWHPGPSHQLCIILPSMHAASLIVHTREIYLWLGCQMQQYLKSIKQYQACKVLSLWRPNCRLLSILHSHVIENTKCWNCYIVVIKSIPWEDQGE